MVSVFVIRHGHSFGNKFDFRQGQVDFPLSPTGVEQATLLSDLLPDSTDVIYSSDLRRASETVEFSDVSALHIESDLLREQDFGRLSGITTEITDSQLPYSLEDHPSVTEQWPDGESFDDVVSRVELFCNKIAEKYSDEDTIGVVSHQGTLFAFRALARDYDGVGEFRQPHRILV